MSKLNNQRQIATKSSIAALIASLMASGKASAQTIEEIDGAVAANTIAGVAEVRMMDDGSIELVLDNGEIVVISADQVEMIGGVPHISPEALTDFAAAARASAPLDAVSNLEDSEGLLIVLL